jgi:hypothetical protein
VNGGPDEVKSLVHDRWKIGDAHSREEVSKLPASIVEDPDPGVLAATMGPPEKHKHAPSCPFSDVNVSKRLHLLGVV